MDESPRSRMNLRQALARQWQIPLFVAAMSAFVVLIIQLRPEVPQVSFEQQYQGLIALSDQGRYSEFYSGAELLRQKTENEEQLAQVHFLAARTRVKELKQRHAFSLDDYLNRSADSNYERIIEDYTQSLARGCPDPNGVESAEVFYDLGQAYWCLNQPDKAILCYNRAIKNGDSYNPLVNKGLVQIYLASRPENYIQESMKHLEVILGQEQTSPDDKAWAYTRKANLLIRQGNEDQALDLLNEITDTYKTSQYSEELEFLRGSALRHAGQNDQADFILRDLLARMTDRGDIYAQVALELGRISYEQYRDQDAWYFYDLVLNTQRGKEWYVAAVLGQAECAAMQQRFDESIARYQEAVDWIKKNPLNQAVESAQIQKSLAILSNKLGMEKENTLALRFLEIERQIAPSDDLDSVYRLAQRHYYTGMQMLEQLQEEKAAVEKEEPSAKEALWFEQQANQINSHFEQAAQYFLQVSALAVGNDELYGQSLEYAALCYDKAGNTDQSIETWKRFVTEREGQPTWPHGLFNLAQSLQSIGKYQEAIGYYTLLRQKHPLSIVASDAVIPLSKCYLAKDPPEQEKAMELLLSVLDDRALTPRSLYYRNAMFELGELYYRNQDYPSAIQILTVAVDRYPLDDRLGKTMFIVGDSYRKSGLKLDEQLQNLSQDPTEMLKKEKTSNLRRQNLEEAKKYFDRSIEFYSQTPDGRRSELDQLYLRHAYLYRADCLYDLEWYEEAAGLYEKAVLRYQLTNTALAAFVQIINCQIRLGNIEQARISNERAIWQLRKMSDEAIASGPVRCSRQQWEEWFDWTVKSGLW
jgi:tetratricopeptide (TPR) repeat protein